MKMNSNFMTQSSLILLIALCLNWIFVIIPNIITEVITKIQCEVTNVYNLLD